MCIQLQLEEQTSPHVGTDACKDAPHDAALAILEQIAFTHVGDARLGERCPLGVQVTFALRSAGDTSRVDTEAVTLSYMFETYNIALPAKLNYGLSSDVLPVPEVAPAP